MWKEIPDFNGRYQISHYGKVLDTKYNRFVNPHLMGVPRANYLQVTLYKKQGSKRTTKHTKRIHSLMAITFLGHKYGDRKMVVDHIDNNKHNNHLSNLRVVTMKQNHFRNKSLQIDI